LSDYLTIRNWDKWQTYRKDRQQPPWIKLHRALMRDPNWIALSDAQRGQLIAVWMLGADREGRIPDDPKLIQRMCFMDKAPDLNLLIAHGFLDARVTPERRQGDAPEESRGEAEERQKIDCADAPKRKSLVPEGWEPTNELIASLEAEGLQKEKILSEVPKFRDHHRSRGTLFRDFPAAFRNWMRNAKEWAAAKPDSGGAARKNGSGWYIKRDSAEYEAWWRHAHKISDYKLQGKLQYGGDEILVQSRWPSK
jgi:hypothetical protein